MKVCVEPRRVQRRVKVPGNCYQTGSAKRAELFACTQTDSAVARQTEGTTEISQSNHKVSSVFLQNFTQLERQCLPT